MSNKYLEQDVRQLSIDEIIEKTSFIFTIRPHLITGQFYGTAGDARKALIMAFRSFRRDIPFKKIGELMGRHYTSIIHLNKEGDNLLFGDKQFKAKYNHLIQELEALAANETHAA